MKILIREEDAHRWKLVETAAYTREDELQKLLAESPGLISIGEVRTGSSPLVVAVREFNLLTGSIDLLAFSADGDIAVIECKLASNVDVKRKVIGQILEYGSNLWEMRYEELDQGIRLRTGSSLVELMEKEINSPDWDEENFRNNVETALANGNFILIIVVDEINDDLAKIIRFVNANSSLGFDFAALEMRKFHSDKAEMLIPRVFGAVHSAKPASDYYSSKRWDEGSFFTELQQRSSEEAVKVAKRILEWSNQKVTTWWGKGKRTGSFVPFFVHKEKEHQLFAVYTYGVVETYFYWMSFKPPFDSEEKRLELLTRLNQIDGVDITREGITKRPSIQLSLLAEGGKIEQLLSVYDWVVDEIKKS